MIDYHRLRELFGVGSYDELRNSYRGWIEESWEVEPKSVEMNGRAVSPFLEPKRMI